jgi:acetyl esterase/lipase
MDAYIADAVSGFTRRALLVIPGGGYANVCSEREGEPIAMAFLPHGYNAFVLHYTTGRKKPFPTQLLEAAEAIARIKARASEYGHSAEEVFVVGFSAGGSVGSQGRYSVGVM